MGGTEWLRSIAGSRIYNFEFLRAGNPLQLLAIIVPGVGFQWEPNDKELMILGGFGLTNHFYAASNFFQYGYLGPLCGALAVLGVMGGLTAKGRMILLTVSVGVLVVMLSGFSPIFAPLLVLPSPLRSVNHYSDVAFTIGFSTLLICLAAQGYVVLSKAGPKARRLFLALFVILVAIAVVGFVSVYGARWREEWIFGFFLVSSLAMVLVLARTRRRRYMLGSTILLLGLLFVDISTSAFWWVRNVAAPITFKQGRQDFTPSPEAGQRPVGDYSGSLLVHRSVLEAEARYGNHLRELPPVALATSIRSLGDDQRPVTELLANGIVEIPTDELQTPALSAFGAQQSKADPAIETTVVQTERTYNSIKFTVKSDRPSIFFNKILYDSPWTVEVNGKAETPTVRAFGAYLGVFLPAGMSEIQLRCRRSLLEMILGISVLWLGISSLLPLIMNGSFRPHPLYETKEQTNPTPGVTA
jgi:hypothetical protein